MEAAADVAVDGADCVEAFAVGVGWMRRLAIIARCYVYALKLKSHGDGSSERKKHGESRAEQTDGGGVVDAAARRRLSSGFVGSTNRCRMSMSVDLCSFCLLWMVTGVSVRWAIPKIFL